MTDEEVKKIYDLLLKKCGRKIFSTEGKYLVVKHPSFHCGYLVAMDGKTPPRYFYGKDFLETRIKKTEEKWERFVVQRILERAQKFDIFVDGTCF